MIDLGPIPDLELSAYPPLRAGLLALKYARRTGDPETLLLRVFTDAQDLPALFSMLVVYATTVYRDVSLPTLSKVIRQIRPEWEEEMLSIAAREWMAEGIAKGKAEGLAQGLAKGLAEGEAKGRAAMLLRQLRRKFGAVSAAIVERVGAADIEQLDDWSERILDAASLSEVFTEKRPQ